MISSSLIICNKISSSEAHHRSDSFVIFIQRRIRQISQSSRHLCQTDGFNNMGYRDIRHSSAATERRSGSPKACHHPPDDARDNDTSPKIRFPHRTRCGKQVGHTSTESMYIPTFTLGSPFSEFIIVLYFGHIVQCGYMPCTTDDDNAFEILPLLCRTYHFTHPRFTYQVTRRGVPRKFFPKSSHSLLYRLKISAGSCRCSIIVSHQDSPSVNPAA